MSIPTPVRESELPADEQSRWFAAEVTPHEQALRSYLHRQYPTFLDVDDVVQESYLRLWRARQSGKIRSVKAYLFAIARNATLAVFRRQRVSPEIAVDDLAQLRVLDQESDVVESVSADEEFQLAIEAMDGLPPRCREIIVLRTVHGLDYDEIAARLGISEHTVRVQMAKAVKRCIQFFRRRGIATK